MRYWYNQTLIAIAEWCLKQIMFQAQGNQFPLWKAQEAVTNLKQMV